MERLVARPDALDEASRRLADATRDIGQELQRLDARSRALAASWSGEAQRAFDTAHRRWQADYDELTELLSRASQAAGAASERYVEAEHENERRWRL